ncbi:MAG TPA: pirin-like C-terminal cupin domain-containing protein, partial [Polyangiaceae bacterium]|nr:pirin-like C-terminal cupin domain-containing protein [Polyangiaceae bacterium]
DSDVAIMTLRMDAGARFTLPAATGDDTLRVLYFFRGKSLRVNEHRQEAHAALAVASDVALELESGAEETDILLLQGRPIGEPVVQHGPFVMNSRAEIEQAIRDYQRTRFGGWPWPKDDPVHAREEGRFARHADGKLERS